MKKKEAKTYNFKLSQEEANVVMQGLGELPSKISMRVIMGLQKQFQEQQLPTKQPSMGKKKTKNK